MIEVMTALVVLAISVLALVSLQIYQLKVSQQSQSRSEASVAAAALLNQSESFALEDFDADLTQARQVHPAQPDFEYEISETVENDDLKRVTVTIYWQEKGRPKELTLWTKFARP